MLAHMSAAAREPEPEPQREPELEPEPEPKPGWTPSGGAGLHAAVRQVCTANPEIGIRALVSEVKQQSPARNHGSNSCARWKRLRPGLSCHRGTLQTELLALWNWNPLQGLGG